MGDVLTFYGERIATESYLRTATERRSILELARLIGYELKPGVAASTLVAFTVEDPPVPVGEALAPRVAVVDVGVKVQSIPGHEEKPQTFETVERIEARAEWNTLRPRLVGPQVIAGSPASLTLAGTDTKLQPGDTVLLVSGLPGSNVADSELGGAPDRGRIDRLHGIAHDRRAGPWVGQERVRAERPGPGLRDAHACRGLRLQRRGLEDVVGVVQEGLPGQGRFRTR